MKFTLLYAMLLTCPLMLSAQPTSPTPHTISVAAMRDIVCFMQSYYKYQGHLKGKALLDTLEHEVVLHDAVAILKAADVLGLQPLIELGARLVVTQSKSREDVVSLMESLGSEGQNQLVRYFYLLNDQELFEDARNPGYSVQDYLDYKPNIIPRKMFPYRLDLARLRLNSLEGINNIPNLERFRFLELDHNMLTHIDSESLKNFTDLILIHLHYNKFTALDKDLFRVVSKLKGVRLEHNNLTDVDPELFACLPNLKSVTMYQNNLSRDCMQALQEAFPSVLFEFERSEAQ